MSSVLGGRAWRMSASGRERTFGNYPVTVTTIAADRFRRVSNGAARAFICPQTEAALNRRLVHIWPSLRRFALTTVA